MALLDDADFIITHIRHSCVTSDDTGMSELVIVNEDDEIITKKAKKCITKLYNSSEDRMFQKYSQSLDISATPSLSLRSKSLTKIEKDKNSKEHKLKCRNVTWKDKPRDLSDDEMAEMFKKYDKPFKAPNQSILALLLEQVGNVDNPFKDYCKFDGEGNVGEAATKKINIYFTMLPEGENGIPMTIIVTGDNACVQDAIGLALWKYTNEGRKPPLKSNSAHGYALHIAEDDGEVDMDFPALDPKESIFRFGFTSLALVEKETPEEQKKKNIVVKVYLPFNGFSSVQVDRLDVPMKDILDKMMRKRRLKKTGPEYILEKKSEPRVTIDLSRTLESMGTLEFCLIRQNSKRSQDKEEDIAGTSSIQASLASHQYKSYRVNMFHKFRANTEIQLGIYGEKIEIDPVVHQRTSKFWSKQKPVSFDIDLVVACEKIGEPNKHNNRQAFRIVRFSANTYKYTDFDGPTDITDEIVTKITNIIESRSGIYRKEYLDLAAERGEKAYKAKRGTSLSSLSISSIVNSLQ
ncbi:Target of rapamycin complex 2 subunit MAPKAP1 [Trichoplax sp. H2]|nr:Target of rapamycin complex 2 subunit MAPKAP1 [Trichoplax sp. H2]|eukprot:RDD47221.1 Target of rapamycin complex 2 subunit MAPKAP1 [Trichoplax sp. H2]